MPKTVSPLVRYDKEFISDPDPEPMPDGEPRGFYGRSRRRKSLAQIEMAMYQREVRFLSRTRRVSSDA